MRRRVRGRHPRSLAGRRFLIRSILRTGRALAVPCKCCPALSANVRRRSIRAAYVQTGYRLAAEPDQGRAIRLTVLRAIRQYVHDHQTLQRFVYLDDGQVNVTFSSVRMSAFVRAVRVIPATPDITGPDSRSITGLGSSTRIQGPDGRRPKVLQGRQEPSRLEAGRERELLDGWAVLRGASPASNSVIR